MMRSLFSFKKPQPAPVSTAPAVLGGMEAALVGLRDRGYTPKVVYDVGAAVGSWTRYAVGLWPGSSFHCFEPLIERRAALDALESAFPQVSVHHIGIGDSDGTLDLGVSESLWDSSFAYAGCTSRTVVVQRIDTLIETTGLPSPNLLKIDVQGFEQRVLRGAERAISRCDFVLLECQFFAFCDEMCTLDKTIMMMSDAGFVPYEIGDFMRRPLDGAMGQCDILFARKSHVLVADHRWSAAAASNG